MGTDDTKARQRLLDAAAEVFSECGYKGATVREICRRAGVGIALVNYHFRDKEGLYLEVYRDLFTRALREYPPDMGLGEDPSAEDRLHAFVRSFLYRLTMVGGRHSLVVRELLDPSPSLVELHNELVIPLQRMLNDILTDLLNPLAAEEYLSHCETSIIGQCLFYGPHTTSFRQHAFGSHNTGQIELIARAITAFSLGGIKAISDSHQKIGDSHDV